MSSEIAIRAVGVSKRYRVYEHPYQRLLDMFVDRQRGREFRALENIDVEIRRGETIAIVGRNGSGKSTLLQILCGTLTPTSGTIEVRGRVAAILELGAGFNPEFSGRENVFLNAALLGMSRDETANRLDEIIEFADIGEFMDEPVRTYSSGMFIRLAFAVAIASEPDILIVDEALAVGDEAFQRKCYARIEQIKQRGATILFVSHSAGVVLQLCDRAILLDHGRRLMTGKPKAVIAQYQRLAYASAEKQPEIIAQIIDEDAGVIQPSPNPKERREGTAEQLRSVAHERYDPELKPLSTVEYTPRGARILAPRILNGHGEQVNVLSPGRSYTYEYEVLFDEDARRVHFGMMVKSMSGIELFGMSSHAQGDAIEHITAGARIRVAFRLRAAMLPGVYFLNAGCSGWIGDDGEGFLHRVLDAAVFRIEIPRTDRRTAGFFDISEEPACVWSEASDACTS